MDPGLRRGCERAMIPRSNPGSSPEQFCYGKIVWSRLFLWFALSLTTTGFALVYPRGLKPVYTSQSKLFHVGEERLSSCLSRVREAVMLGP